MNDPETTEELISDVLSAADQAAATEAAEDPPQPQRIRREDLDWGSAI